MSVMFFEFSEIVILSSLIQERVDCWPEVLRLWFPPHPSEKNIIWLILILAHLSRRLTRWAYGIAMIRRPSVHNFKHLRNRLANQSQILCGGSFVGGNESLLAASGSTWPRWPPRPYMVKKALQKPSPEPMDRFPRNLVYTCSIRESCPS